VILGGRGDLHPPFRRAILARFAKSHTRCSHRGDAYSERSQDGRTAFAQQRSTAVRQVNGKESER
jgi:hypothetical protein